VWAASLTWFASLAEGLAVRAKKSGSKCRAEFDSQCRQIHRYRRYHREMGVIATRMMPGAGNCASSIRAGTTPIPEGLWPAPWKDRSFPLCPATLSAASHAQSRNEMGKSLGEKPGEGIGLSIVKRLCDMLDATIELSRSQCGTSFRILVPRRYDS
jgi:hypothetical protein